MTQILTFVVQTYSEPNAILLPGRNTRLQDIQYTNIQLLPSSTSKRSVYTENVKTNGITTFRLASETNILEHVETIRFTYRDHKTNDRSVLGYVRKIALLL